MPNIIGKYYTAGRLQALLATLVQGGNAFHSLILNFNKLAHLTLPCTFPLLSNFKGKGYSAGRLQALLSTLLKYPNLISFFNLVHHKHYNKIERPYKGQELQLIRFSSDSQTIWWMKYSHSLTFSRRWNSSLQAFCTKVIKNYLSSMVFLD
jgi:hypothetical protein